MLDLTYVGETAKHKIEFKKANENNALMVYSSKSIDGTIINELLSEGYISATDGYGTNSDSWYDEELKETVYQYEVIYEPIIIMKDETNSIYFGTLWRAMLATM